MIDNDPRRPEALFIQAYRCGPNDVAVALSWLDSQLGCLGRWIAARFMCQRLRRPQHRGAGHGSTAADAAAPTRGPCSNACWGHRTLAGVMDQRLRWAARMRGMPRAGNVRAGVCGRGGFSGRRDSDCARSCWPASGCPPRRFSGRIRAEVSEWATQRAARNAGG